MEACNVAIACTEHAFHLASLLCKVNRSWQHSTADIIQLVLVCGRVPGDIVLLLHVLYILLRGALVPQEDKPCHADVQ